jgi:hypothetical protein
LHFLRHCEKPSFLEFLCTNTIYLTKLLDAETRESKYMVLATNKKCAFQILELAYKRLHKDELFYATAKLCIVFETSKFGAVKDGKELTKEVCKKTVSLTELILRLLLQYKLILRVKEISFDLFLNYLLNTKLQIKT